MQTQQQGYYRSPTIYDDRIVFVSENDLWEVPKDGGKACRLTSNLGEVSSPRFSPDGKWIAFTGREEGMPEIYVMPGEGGVAKRLTYQGNMCYVVGWDGKKIIFASNYASPFFRYMRLYDIDLQSGKIDMLPFGPATHFSHGKGVVLGRYMVGLSRWKRYRGGRIGQIWVDTTESGNFKKLKLKGNLSAPMWIKDRIFFLSDQDGVGNIYSCRPDGKMLKRHTYYREFYCRDAQTDGQSIVYQNGADVHILDLKTDNASMVEIRYSSPQVQMQRKFVSATRYLEDYSLSSDGSSLAVITRGKAFSFGNWEGPVNRHGAEQGVRYRMAKWLPDGKHLAVVSDELGEDHIEIRPLEKGRVKIVKPDIDIGRIQRLEISPEGENIAVSNHRNELIVVNWKKNKAVVVERNEFAVLFGFDWSPDGAWIAYAININRHQSIIRLYNIESGQISDVSDPMLEDDTPVFDPGGRYLYFLSTRIFNPVYSNMDFALSFPRGMRPYLVTLRKETTSPFVASPRGFKDAEKGKKKGKKGKKKGKKEKVIIDLDGIKDRIIPFPAGEGLYRSIAASENRVFYTVYPAHGALGRSWADSSSPANAKIMAYDFSKLESGILASGVSSFTLSADGTALAYRKGNLLRVVESRNDFKQELPKETAPSRKSGWINLERLKVAIDPRAEWRQMFAEAWRLQRDYFWVENMSQVDWQKIYDRYYPFIERLGSRREFSDLLWEMQGELGTSHAYELGGDYSPSPYYRIGFLGATFEYDKKKKGYVIKRLARSDVWHRGAPPPLKQPGINVLEGMLLLKVNGQKLNAGFSPYQALVNMAREEVTLEIAESDGKGARTVTVKTLASENYLWYRDWVEHNRRYVHEKSEGKLGYIHIPDMGPSGYAEFHRHFLAELEYEGLVVDVRFNGGGHVSPLLLEKLARKRYGYYRTRWMGNTPKPGDCAKGPMVALTNESAGSDGDLFSYGFKAMKLGKVIGTRTWGGVVGIWPRNWLVDGTLTTQPEFSNWFFDVGYGVENHGVDPDIEVAIKPQDYKAGKDPQLNRAIKEALREVKENPAPKPELSEIPKLLLPQ